MVNKTMQDIKAYLGYLAEAGYPVSVCLAETAPEAFRAEFASFAPRGKTQKAALVIRQKERPLAEITFSGERKPPEALLLPLPYLFEKLYDQSGEYLGHNSLADAYKKALHYIHNHFTENITVAELAREIGYSSSYFGYAFKKIRGTPVNRYVLQLRLEKAAELLRETALPVSAVAEKAGFRDANYFSTVFKKHYGCPPGQYRK